MAGILSPPLREDNLFFGQAENSWFPMFSNEFVPLFIGF